MNAGIKIDLDGSFERYSLQTMILDLGSGEEQFDGRIMELNHNAPGCQRGDYETQSFTAVIADGDGDLKSVLKDIYSKAVTLYDETGTQRAKLIALRPDFSERGKVKLICSDRFQETENQNAVNQEYEITTENFPSSPESSQGQFYNFFSGNFQTWDTVNFPGQNGLRCWLIDSQVTGTGGKYAIGKAGANTTGKVPAAPDALIDDSGNALTVTGWAITLAADGLYYITKAGQANLRYIDINITLSGPVTLKEIFSDVSNEFFSNFPFTSSPDARDLFAFDRWHLDPESSLDNSWRDPHYSIAAAITGTQILNQLCMGELNYYVDAAGEIVFHAIDYENISPEVYQNAEAFEFTEQANRQDQTRLVNDLTIEFGKQPGGSFESIQTERNWESRSAVGFWQKQTVQNHFFGNNSKSVQLYGNGAPVASSILKRILMNNKSPLDEWTFKIYNLTEWIEKDIFNYAKFNHPAFPQVTGLTVPATGQTMMVLRRRIDYKNNTMEVDFQNITKIAEMDTAQKFLFQANPFVEGGIFFRDVSVNGYNYTSYEGESGQPVQTLTDQKFTRGAVEWNGADQGKSFGNSIRHDDWKIDGDFLFWIWVKFPTLGNDAFIRNVRADANNFVTLRKQADDTLQFAVVEGGAPAKINHKTDGGTAQTPLFNWPDTGWHLLVFARSGSNAGFYFDGNQLSHLSYTYTPGTPYPFGAPIYTAQDGTGNYYNFRVSEFGFYKNDHGPLLTSLAPNASLTDSFTLPTGAITDTRGEFIDYSLL